MRLIILEEKVLDIILGHNKALSYDDIAAKLDSDEIFKLGGVLNKLEKELKHLKNKHVSATETKDGESLIFLHKVKDGSVDKSYGINVAKLAGLPSEVITRASEILIAHEDKSKKQQNLAIQTSLPLEFIDNKKSEIEEILRSTNILELTPLKALTLLNELKEKIK